MFTDTTKKIENAVKALPVFKLDLTSKDDHARAANAFLLGRTGKFGKYFAVENALVFRTIIQNERGTDLRVEQNVIALKVERDGNTTFIGNSTALPLIGRSVSFGREHLNSGETDVQRYLAQFITMVPFNVFREANLDLTKCEVLQRGPEETVKQKVDRWDATKRENVTEIVNRHFTGASLFRIDEHYFLFDFDRRELEHNILNPFLVELVKPALTIADAYDGLKPDVVKLAESQGATILRQGEWFFIKAPSELNVVETPKQNNWSRGIELRAGPNRPNYAERGGKTSGLVDGKETLADVVSGKVTHSGREHAELDLGASWWFAVPNTSTRSFTIRGDVD